MKTRYYVCGLGYDENDCITDHEQSFGDFDTYEEAYELFVKLQCQDVASLFTNTPHLYQWLIQLEECEETEDVLSCTDVKNEWWIVNPSFAFAAYTRKQYNGISFIDNKTMFDSKERAIAFAKAHSWEGVMDNGTGEIVWENKEELI